MKKFFVCAMVAVFSAMPALATEDYTINAVQVPVGLRSLGVPYDNVETSMMSGYAAGGAALQGANTITKMIMDDITTDPAVPGEKLNAFVFCVFNNNTAAVSARYRIRFFRDNAGTPGNYATEAGGFSFNPILFPVGESCFLGDVTAALVTFPTTGTFWAGATFDNNNGGTGASAAQLNNLGMMLYNPPAIGSSVDGFRETNAAGSFFGSNLLPGDTSGVAPLDGGGNNLAFAFIPEPGTVSLLVLGAMSMIRRRK